MKDSLSMAKCGTPSLVTVVITSGRASEERAEAREFLQIACPVSIVQYTSYWCNRGISHFAQCLAQLDTFERVVGFVKVVE